MATTPLTRQELDPMRCGTPGCMCAGPLVLHPRCHPRAATWHSYDWTTGLLTVTCGTCERFICQIAVAAGPTDDSRAALTG